MCSPSVEWRENGGLATLPGVPILADRLRRGGIMSLALGSSIPGELRREQASRDQRFLDALDTLLARGGSTHTASQLIELGEGIEDLMQRDAGERLLRAGVPERTIDLVTRTINAARDLTSWWPAERVKVQAPADLAAIVQPLFGRSAQEQLHIAIVDGRNGLLDVRHVYTGTATGTSVRIGELLRPVLSAYGVGFAAVHNHPSGDPEPSDEDLRLTSELLAAARLLDIEFLDHLVIGHGRWVSIRSARPMIWGGEAQ
jgi:DNA repair protein RadC